MSYENPKNKITAVPATDEEIWGATFKVVANFYIQNKFVFCSRSFSVNLLDSSCVWCPNHSIRIIILDFLIVQEGVVSKYFKCYYFIEWT